MSTEKFYCGNQFVLESGSILPSYELGYTTHGKMNAAGDNVVWVFHALTANSDPAEWWPMLIGADMIFDPASHFIVCVNMPGSCYGSTGPLSINPKTKVPYYHNFPVFTPRDMIRSYQALKDHLNIKKIKVGIGGSMGGQQLLEWAIEEPELFENIFPIATNATHSAWGRAFNASQRFCIETDPTWPLNDASAGMKGMEAARSVALLSYRHYGTYAKSQEETEHHKLSGYKSESYQRYQGEKLAKRFNAFSYYVLSQSMDAHNVGRGRSGIQNALNKIKARTTVIGISTDILFPLSEQELLARHIPGATFHAIDSENGHDGFLLEYDEIAKIINNVLIEV